MINYLIFHFLNTLFECSQNLFTMSILLNKMIYRYSPVFFLFHVET